MIATIHHLPFTGQSASEQYSSSSLRKAAATRISKFTLPSSTPLLLLRALLSAFSLSMYSSNQTRGRLQHKHFWQSQAEALLSCLLPNSQVQLSALSSFQVHTPQSEAQTFQTEKVFWTWKSGCLGLIVIHVYMHSSPTVSLYLTCDGYKAQWLR